MAKETYYDRLGLPRDATPEEIRRVYRELARRLHPDHNVRPEDTELFIGIQEAFDTLSNPQLKSKYDGSLPAQPVTEAPLLIKVQYSRNSLVHMPDPQLIYALIEFHPQADLEFITPPLNVCLVLDCSTSMQGSRLDTVKATAIELVRQLRPIDVFSIVHFSDRAEVLVPATTHSDLRMLETRIQLLQASGGTEIYQGLQAGIEEIRRYRSLKHVNHIMLITDGRTYGDEADCLRLADQASTMGISISALGIGSQWNDAFLDQLCSRTGGNSKFVAKIDDIHQFFQEKVSSLNRSFAEHVTYSFDASPGVELTYAFRLHPETSPLEICSPLILGTVPRDASHNLLLEFTVKDIPSDTNQITLAKGRVSYDIPGSNNQINFFQRLELSRPTQKDFDADIPAPNLVQAMARLTLYRMQERARQEIEQGQIKEASRRLQNLATHLLAQGQRDLARSVLSEVAHIQQYQSFSEEGDKKIKYGTRSLLLPPGTKEKKK